MLMAFFRNQTIKIYNMKKFYLLCTAACVAATASAAEKEMKAPSNAMPSASLEQVMSPKMNLAPKAMVSKDIKKNASATRADEVEYVYYRPAAQTMSVGWTSNSYSFNHEYGFASSNGDVVFNNLSFGVSGYEWNFSDVNGFDGENWLVKTSSDTDLSIKASIGEMMVPVLNATSGAKGSYVIEKDFYIIGGGPSMWFQEDEESGNVGVTFYQNMGYRNLEGYPSDINQLYAYYPGANGWNKNGVYVYSGNPNNWEAVFNDALGSKVSNLAMDSYIITLPEPTSGYLFTTGWVWAMVSAKSDTQLISYVYPMTEDGAMSETAIAIGYASIPKGESSTVQFYYYPLNEEGDELEGDVFVDTAAFVTIEGFAGNDAIELICPNSGYYPFPLDAYRAGDHDLWKDATLYLTLRGEAGGDTYSGVFADEGGYYLDQREEGPGVTLDRNTIAPLCYAVFNMDAVYPFIYSVDDIDVVNLPIEGGEASVVINALYYNINNNIAKGIYEVTAPEWLTVSFGESDYETGNTTMTVSVAAGEDRTGVVTIEGLGAKYSLTVNQGEGNAVSVIAIDKNAEYFDLQGRRVANPEKGIFIKKSGNKAEKVIF